jgi:hypothetical protein
MVVRLALLGDSMAAGAHVADRDHATAEVFAADRSLFCSDRFHPSSAGYAVIAEALRPAVAAALQAHEDRAGAARPTSSRASGQTTSGSATAQV